MDFRNVKQRDIADIFNITPRTVRRWTDLGLPKNKDGGYDLPACVQWVIDRLESQRPSKEDGEGQRWLSEFRKERTLITRLERERLEGRLISVEEVERKFTNRCYEFRNTLLLLPRRVAHRIAAKSKKQLREVEAILDEEVRTYLMNYARPIELDETVKP